QASENEMLDLDLESLMQIQITSAGRKAQNLSDVPAAVYVIDQEDIHNSGVTSIPEALRMVPGLQIARISSSKWAITSRGFNGTYATKLLVQIDGRSVYTPSFSGVYWDVQNVVLEDVDRIEVIRGPGATLWGANAVNGIINVITKQSSDTQGALVSVGAGDHERLMATARYGTQLNENTYARIYLQRHDQDSYEFLDDKTDGYDDWNLTQGGFRFDGDINLKDSWTFQGDYYRNETNQRNDTYWEWPSLSPLQREDSFNPEGFNFLGRWTHNYSDTSSWSLQSYYDDYKREEGFVHQDHRILDVDFQHRFQPVSRHDVVWGMGYRLIKDGFGNTDQVMLSPEKETTTIYSAFAQNEINLVADYLWLTIGSKIERNDYTGTEIQPSFRLLWKPQAKHSLWAGVSRAMRTPSRAEDSAQITIGMIQIQTQLPPPYPPEIVVPLQVINNPDLEAEELLAYEAGYRFKASNNLSLDLALYYNSYKDLVTYQSTATGLQFFNGMEGHTYGFELSAEWTPVSWLKNELSYGYISLDIDKADSVDSNLQIVAEKSSPQHQLSVRSNIAMRNNLHLNLWGRYVDNVDAASTVALMSGLEVDSYFELDANIVWQPREGLELMIAGQNLLDNRHLEFVQEQFTSPIEIERSIYAKLTWEF
ncbi:MAG: TonB-dependent receptor, partial [Desulfuromusa sp.]|nr:TonB-dependent receptor [Desulfuromusa sp.]